MSYKLEYIWLDGWKGYLEDRRPASHADPYKIAARLLTTLNS